MPWPPREQLRRVLSPGPTIILISSSPFIGITTFVSLSFISSLITPDFCRQTHAWNSDFSIDQVV